MSLKETDTIKPQDLISIKPDCGRDQGVLRIEPALPVHGPGQSAVGADAQAAAQRPRTRRSFAGPGRFRGPGRSLYPLRSDVSDRDAGRSEHRPHRIAGELHTGERLRIPGDSVPESRRRSGHPGHRVSLGDGRREVQHRAGECAHRQGRTVSRTDWFRSARAATTRPSRPKTIQYMDVSPKQIISVSASLIPVPRARRCEPRAHGIEHAAAGGAPCLSRAPAGRNRYGGKTAYDSGVLLKAKRGGTIEYVTSRKIVYRAR